MSIRPAAITGLLIFATFLFAVILPVRSDTYAVWGIALVALAAGLAVSASGLIYENAGAFALTGALTGFAGVMAFALGTAAVYPDVSLDGGNGGWFTLASLVAIPSAGHAAGFASFWRFSRSGV